MYCKVVKCSVLKCKIATGVSNSKCVCEIMPDTCGFVRIDGRRTFSPKSRQRALLPRRTQTGCYDNTSCKNA